MTSILDWAVFLLVNGTALYASWCVAGRLLRGDDRAALAVVAAALAYLAHITLVVLFLGVVVRVLNYASVLATSLLLSGTLIYFLRGYRRPLLAPLAAGWREIFAGRDLVLYTLAVLFGLQVLILLAKIVWLPPAVWDVFYYHLTPAVEWYQQGRIPLLIDTPAQHMNRVPLGMTVLSYWFFVFFGDDFLVELPMFLWALLLLPVTYAFLRESGVEGSWAAKFAIVVFFIPIVLMQGITNKDHLGLNVGLLAALLFVAGFLRHRDHRHLLVAAIAFGLILGFKRAALAYLGVSFAVVLLLVFLDHRELLTEAAARRRLLRTLALGGGVSALIGGYWYAKKLFVGDQVGMALLLPPPAAGEASRFSLEGFVNNLGHFLPRVFDYRSLYTADLIQISGFGPQFAAFGLIALLAALVLVFRRRETRAFHYPALAVSLVLLALFMISAYANNPNSYRNLSFLPMVMIAFAAVLCRRWGLLEARGGRAAIGAVMVIAVVWNLVVLLPPQLTNPRLLKEFVAMDAGWRTSGTYTKWFSVHRPNLYRLLATLPATEPIAIVSQPVFREFFRKGVSETWSYPYYDRHWQRRLHYLYKADYLQCNERHVCAPRPLLKQHLRERGVRLVSTCPTNRCAFIDDADFVSLTPGFYYLREAG